MAAAQLLPQLDEESRSALAKLPEREAVGIVEKVRAQRGMLHNPSAFVLSAARALLAAQQPAAQQQAPAQQGLALVPPLSVPPPPPLVPGLLPAGPAPPPTL